MLNEDQQLTVYNHTEQAELQRRASRSAFWLGAAPYHPDIHRDRLTQDDEVNSAPRVHNITVSVPLNTGLVGGIIKREQFNVSTDISFEDLFERLCAKMNLNPCDASLGYKFNKDLRRTKYNELTNEDQLRTALAHGVELIERARTKPVVLEIQNLYPARQEAIASAGRKRAADEIENVAPQNDDVPKKIKTAASSNASASSSAAVQINIANFTPLSDRSGQRHMNMSISPTTNSLVLSPLTIAASSPTASNSSSDSMSHSATLDNIIYPDLDTVLHQLHPTFPNYNLPGCIDALLKSGITTVHDVCYADDQLLVEAGVPMMLVDLVKDWAARLALTAEGHRVSAPSF